MKCTLILDVPGLDRSTACEELKEQLGNFGVTAVDAPTLTQAIVSQWREWFGDDARRKSTLVVLPGNGACAVRRYLPPRWLEQHQWRPVEAKRHWEPGKDPWVEAGRINPTRWNGIKMVIILDNVISSGTTIHEVMHVNDMILPNATWHAVAWIRQASAFTKRFDGVYSPLVVGSAGGRVPINSLSSLLANAKMATSYAHRNFGEQANALIGFLAELRERLPSERERVS